AKCRHTVRRTGRLATTSACDLRTRSSIERWDPGNAREEQRASWMGSTEAIRPYSASVSGGQDGFRVRRVERTDLGAPVAAQARSGRDERLWVTPPWRERAS